MLLSTFICGVSTFSAHNFVSPKDNNKGRAIDNRKNEPEPNFHVVAARLGKTVLRPGGSDASRIVHEQANIQQGDTVLELAAGLGRSGIELAKIYGAQVTLTDMDASRLERAKQFAIKDGVSDLVSVKELDMFNIGSLFGDVKFDVAQTEASLTHYPRSQKAKFFQGVANHANKFILHEVYLKTDDAARQDIAKKDLSKALNVGFAPETADMWQQLLTDAGFQLDHVNTGDLAVLDPLSIIKDEGMLGFAKIIFNVATHPYLRSRMLRTKRAMEKHADDLGYITIVASKK